MCECVVCVPEYLGRAATVAILEPLVDNWAPSHKIKEVTGFECDITTSFVVSNLSVILVLDLSKPEELWTTLEVALKQVMANPHICLLISPAPSKTGGQMTREATMGCLCMYLTPSHIFCVLTSLLP